MDDRMRSRCEPRRILTACAEEGGVLAAEALHAQSDRRAFEFPRHGIGGGSAMAMSGPEQARADPVELTVNPE